MRAFFLGAFLFLTVLAAHADTAKAETTPSIASATSGPDFRRAVEKQTFELVNDYRKDHDLALLAWNDEVAKLARAHSKDMATGEVDFGHEGFGDRVRAIKGKLAGLRGAGENVLYTSDLDDVAKLAVEMWLHSPHHLANIRGDFNYSGLGVWQSQDGTVYFTQIFAKIIPPAQQSQEAQAAAPLPPIDKPDPFIAPPFSRVK